MPNKISNTYAAHCKQYIEFIYIKLRVFVERSIRCHSLLPKPNSAVFSPLIWEAVLDSLYRIQAQTFSFLEPKLTSDIAQKQKGEVDRDVRKVILPIM